jgi:hypothetical protein
VWFQSNGTKLGQHSYNGDHPWLSLKPLLLGAWDFMAEEAESNEDVVIDSDVN